MRKLIVLLATLSISSLASAGFLLEAHLGYATTGQLKYTRSGTNYVFNSSSIPLGLLIGYMGGNGLWMGINTDYHMSGTAAKSAGATADDSFTRLKSALEFGYGGSKWQVFAGYSFMNDLSISKATANTNSPDGLHGSGYYIGMGYKFSPKFAMQLRYDVYSYTKYDLGATKNADVTATNYATNSDGDLVINFSFPFMGGK